MSLEPLVIDTCSFRDAAFIASLRNYHGNKYISSITYAEMQVYLIGMKGKDPDFFDRLLRKSNIQIEWFRRDNALDSAFLGAQFGDFNKRARDYMIASHAYNPPWIVVTYNKKDFDFLTGRVFDPDEFKRIKGI